MISTSATPRPLPATRPGGSSPLPLLLAGAAAAICVRAAIWLDAPLPQCWLRKLTGIPCPSCGGTRSLAAWAALDLEQAFRFNPLFFLVCVSVLAWSALWLVEKLCRRTFLDRPKARVKLWPWWKIGAVLLGLNWLYLCLTLPK